MCGIFTGIVYGRFAWDYFQARISNYVADLEALPSLIEKTISDTKQIQAVAAKILSM